MYQMGIRGGVSITDEPSHYIIYPSRSLPDGKGVLLASYTLDDDSLFFTALKHNQVVDIVLNDLATVHQIPKEELWHMCPSSVVKKWSLDSLAMGTFADFTPYQFVHYSDQLSQPEEGRDTSLASTPACHMAGWTPPSRPASEPPGTSRLLWTRRPW